MLDSSKAKTRVLQTYPLKMNLVLEIRMDLRRVGEILPSVHPLSPKSPHLLSDDSIELYTSL